MKKRFKDADPQNDELNVPRVSLVIPYEVKMKSKAAFLALLTNHADKAEIELLAHFPEEQVAPVMKKLRKVIKTIQCPPPGKNLAVFVSACAEKVYYFSPSKLEKYKLPVLKEGA